MCGLFGFCFWDNDAVTYEQRLLLLSSLVTGNWERGKDAWGYYDGKVITKAAGEATKAFPLVDAAKCTTLLGHTRQGTVGPKTESACAHPFRVGPVVGMHNGMISNHSELKSKYKREQVQVDSEHIFYTLAENGDTREISGWGPFVWTDERDPNKINFCMINSGSLSVWRVGPKDKPVGIVWSSEYKHGAMALDLARLERTVYQALISDTRYYIITNPADDKDMELLKGDKLPFGPANRGGYQNGYGGCEWPNRTNGSTTVTNTTPRRRQRGTAVSTGSGQTYRQGLWVPSPGNDNIDLGDEELKVMRAWADEFFRLETHFDRCPLKMKECEACVEFLDRVQVAEESLGGRFGKTYVVARPTTTGHAAGVGYDLAVPYEALFWDEFSEFPGMIEWDKARKAAAEAAKADQPALPEPKEASSDAAPKAPSSESPVTGPSSEGSTTPESGTPSSTEPTAAEPVGVLY